MASPKAFEWDAKSAENRTRAAISSVSRLISDDIDRRLRIRTLPPTIEHVQSTLTIVSAESSRLRRASAGWSH